MGFFDKYFNKQKEEELDQGIKKPRTVFSLKSQKQLLENQKLVWSFWMNWNKY